MVREDNKRISRVLKAKKRELYNVGDNVNGDYRSMMGFY